MSHNSCSIRFSYKFTKDVIYGRYISNKFIFIQDKKIVHQLQIPYHLF